VQGSAEIIIGSLSNRGDLNSTHHRLFIERSDRSRPGSLDRVVDGRSSDAEQLRDLRCRVVALPVQVDQMRLLSGRERRLLLLFNVLGMVAEFEADLIWMRTREDPSRTTLLTSTRTSRCDHPFELVDLQGQGLLQRHVPRPATSPASAIEPSTCATRSRPRPAKTKITVDPDTNNQPATTSKGCDQRWVSSPLRSSAARIWLSHSVPSWRPFGSWSPPSQRQVVVIASTRIRHSRSKS
jgi:hypothetical protein